MNHKQLCNGAFFFLKQEHKAVLMGCMLLFFFSLAGIGQSYFYFGTKVKKADSSLLTYYIFLTVNTDGSAEGRILYKDANGENKLVRQNFTDSSFTATDTANDSLKYLVPSGMAKLADETTDSSFTRLRFLFKKQQSDSAVFYVPAGIEYSIDDASWHTASLVTAEQKTYAWLAQQPDFVGLFFNRYEPFYKYLFDIGKRGLNNIEKNTRMFLIVVANTRDSLIGTSCAKDLDAITTLFQTLSSNMGITLNQKIITASTFSKAAVDDAINNWLKPAPDDIVVFYYTGHGFRYSLDISQYPRMSFRINGAGILAQNNLAVEDVYNRILKKGARVNIVLTDCCNEDIGLPPALGHLPFLTRDVGTAGQKLNIDNCRALFFPGYPLSILSCGAKAGQRSVGNPALGGFFSNFLREEMNKTLYGSNGTPSWLRMLLNAQTNTARQAMTALCGDHRCIQTMDISVIPPQ